MSEEPRQPARPALADTIDTQARRKLHARRHATPGMWPGLGMMGLIGWSVVVPTLAGAALGLWIDRHYPGPHSWTLALLVGGLVIGCFQAWSWVAKEEQAMRDEQSEQQEQQQNPQKTQDQEHHDTSL